MITAMFIIALKPLPMYTKLPNLTPLPYTYISALIYISLPHIDKKYPNHYQNKAKENPQKLTQNSLSTKIPNKGNRACIPPCPVLKRRLVNTRWRKMESR